MGVVVNLAERVEVSKPAGRERMPAWADPQKWALDHKQVSKTADGFESAAEVNYILSDLLAQEKWRDALLFVTGLNTRFRPSDLRRMTWSHIIDEDGYIKKQWDFTEQKTSKYVLITTNEALRKMIDLYIEKVGLPDNLDTPMFLSKSNNKNHIIKVKEKGSHKITDRIYSIPPVGMDVASINRAIKAEMDRLGLNKDGRRLTAYAMRKTAANAAAGLLPDKPVPDDLYRRAMPDEAVSGWMNHSSVAVTGHYIDRERLYAQMFLFINLGIEAIDEYLNTQKGN